MKLIEKFRKFDNLVDVQHEMRNISESGDFPIHGVFLTEKEYMEELDAIYTYKQLKCLNGLNRLILKCNFLDRKYSTVDKIKYYYKFQCGYTKGYSYWLNDKYFEIKNKEDIPDGAVHILPTVKSSTELSRKQLNTLIDLQLSELQSNEENMDEPVFKEYCSIKDEMEENKLRNLQNWTKEQDLQKAIKKEFGGNNGV